MRPSAGSALTGMASAAAALATTEVVGVAIDRHRPTVVAAVASRLVVLFAGPLRRPAIAVFGVHDKAALIVGIVLLALLAGVALGLAGHRRRWVPPAAMTLVAALGVAAAWRDPLASARSAAVACLAAVVVGESTRRALARLGVVAEAGMSAGRRQRVSRSRSTV